MRLSVGSRGPSRGTLKVSSINSVFTNAALGTVHSASSSLGAATTIANGTIRLGGIPAENNFSFANLTYTGTGEITDRVIELGRTSGDVAGGVLLSNAARNAVTPQPAGETAPSP